jgi:gamma-glutamylcyclotransferase (GGCT)/AIG2-like uncharacterized protein YtfP
MTYYFAYGLNTNLDSMALRCPDAVNMGVGYLDNYRMVFRYHADMVPDAGHTAPGVLWHITPSCLNSLDMLEGFPEYYQRKTVTVTLETGETVEAIMYYMNNNDHLSEPSNSYYDMVLQGYDSHGISEKYLIDGLRPPTWQI